MGHEPAEENWREALTAFLRACTELVKHFTEQAKKDDAAEKHK